MRPPRFELGTPGLEGRCSIQLSYGRVVRQMELYDVDGSVGRTRIGYGSFSGHEVDASERRRHAVPIDRPVGRKVGVDGLHSGRTAQKRHAERVVEERRHGQRRPRIEPQRGGDSSRERDDDEQIGAGHQPSKIDVEPRAALTLAGHGRPRASIPIDDARWKIIAPDQLVSEHGRGIAQDAIASSIAV